TSIARSREYDKGDVIIHAEESADVFCLIEEGKVKITMISPDGKEIILSTFGAGDFFGEMAILDEEPRSASVIAVNSVRLQTIFKDDFLNLLRENFGITRKILAELSGRLRTASHRIESLATMDVYGRLARYFLDLAEKEGKEDGRGYLAIERPTHQAIANTIGTSRETVSRLLHDLIERKLLVEEGRTIYLQSSAIEEFRGQT
ncbi:MAG: Crp/Fnr family transcriptional regulator, partial [Thermoanaerobaculia bacterium]|nr:Crp/Fnr family transcriptional regulator [Thermoanaerobaculia bacterium]